MADKNHELVEIRQVAFLQAREKLCLSTKDLSQMACLSVRQIEQIENGEQGAFYSPKIKITAAKKVAGILGLAEQDAFDIDSVDDSTNSKKQSSETEKFIPKKDIDQLPARNIKTREDQTRIIPLSTDKPIHNKRKRLFIWLALIATIIFSIINVRALFFSEPIEEVIVINEEVALPLASPTQASAPVSVPSTEPPAKVQEAPITTRSLTPTEPIREVAVSTKTLECPIEDPKIIRFRPATPLKLADGVMIKAREQQVVCVIDAAGVSQLKSLDQGSDTFFAGKAPLKILTNNLSQVELFFQGVKVRPAGLNEKTILLEPAEIIRPQNQISIPMDSGLR